MRGPTRIAEILRDFVEVHHLVREVAERHRSRGLRFSDLDALIRDDEGSVLFRLKERSHLVFREPGDVRGGATHREALFDLAVGSLFHEAMKLRENLYQREVYGPRVRALRAEVREESKSLFEEFERMLGTIGGRLDEGIRELETLAQQTSDQLRLLISHPPDDGAARFVTEHADQVPKVFGVTLAELLEEMYGSVAEGFEKAGRAYLASGSFEAAGDRFERALAQPDVDPRVAALRDYANGMHAYLKRDYSAAVRDLSAWATAGPLEEDLVPLARDVLASVVQLAEGSDRDRVSEEASAASTHLRAAASGGARRRAAD
jgi:hypothetical protein